MMNAITNGLLENPYTHYLNLKYENDEKHGKKHDTCDSAYHSFFEALNYDADH